MKFDKFEITSSSHIVNATCECGYRMEEVSNGWFSSALFCKECENVYELKLIKVPKKKIGEDFLVQCRVEANRQT